MSNDIPEHYQKFKKNYPDLFQQYENLGKHAFETGPLDRKSAQLIKLGFCIASELEGATHAHVRKCRDLDISFDEIRHVAVLAITTLGFPKMMKALSWIDDIESNIVS